MFFLTGAVELLKLYQFFPAKLNKDVVELTLLFALAQGDFHVCSLLLNAQIRSDERISKVFALNDALETATYARFWALFKMSDYSQRVPTLLPKVQELVLEGGSKKKNFFLLILPTVVGLTYQRIELKQLLELLGVSSDAELGKILAGKPGWAIEGDLVRVPLQAMNQNVPVVKTGANSTNEQKLAILAALKR
jgi:hypothetical protein